MEIKDVILSTLKEIEDSDEIFDDEEVETNKSKNSEPTPEKSVENNKVSQAMMSMTSSNTQKESKETSGDSEEKVPSHQITPEDFMSAHTKPSHSEPTTSTILSNSKNSSIKEVLEDEKLFLNSVRERVLVLFEGLQSPNNRNIEAKVDLIINFLEYKLAIIDERLEKIQKDILSI
jgi:hypothetical protein